MRKVAQRFSHLRRSSRGPVDPREQQRHQPAGDIIAAGLDAATVTRVLDLVRRAEFKRKQAAPGLKVTDRAFGTGWRMPIATKLTLD